MIRIVVVLCLQLLVPILGGPGCRPDAPPPAFLLAVTTNGHPGVLGPDTPLRAGGALHRTYRLTNSSDFPVRDVAVADGQAGPVRCPAGTLPPWAAMTCVADGTAGAGRHAGTVRASGRYTGRHGRWACAEATAPVGYVGVAGGLALRESLPATAEAGSRVAVAYAVTNTGTVPLYGIAVTDELAGNGGVRCPAVPRLDPGQRLACDATPVALAGRHRGTSRVSGTDRTAAPGPTGAPLPPVIITATATGEYLGTLRPVPVRAPIHPAPPPPPSRPAAVPAPSVPARAAATPPPRHAGRPGPGLPLLVVFLVLLLPAAAAGHVIRLRR
ncbi:MAG: hypothetical protein ACJ73S_20915 [Mycobacteriales bacterium]